MYRLYLYGQLAKYTPEVFMPISIERLIDLLTKDLELEYFAAIQYINHAAELTID